jgi:4-amino-4-deoxy-L-arabinose transferase-like glycosyltransferase
VLLAGAATLLFLWGAAGLPLADPDEGRYAEAAREMLASGSPLSPQLFGVPYLEKPPLIYWLTAASLWLFGPSELSARLPSVLAAGVGVLWVGLFGARAVHPRAGFFASLVLATSGLYFVLARTLLTDMVFAVALTGALLAFFGGAERLWNEKAAFLGFWAALALAVLAKGPIAMALGAGAIGGFLWWNGSFEPLTRRCFWWPAPLFVAVALPWFVWASLRYPGFASYYLLEQHLARAAGSEHREPVWWLAPWVLVGGLPWTPIALGAGSWWRDALSDPAPGRRLLRFCTVWAAAVFFVFTVSAGKLVPYILPMFPPLALIVGAFLHERIAEGSVPTSLALVRRALAAAALLSLVASPAVAATLSLRAPRLLWSAYGTALLAAASAGLWWWRRRPARPVEVIGALVALLYVAAATIAPAIAERFTPRAELRLLARVLGPGDEVALAHSYFPSVAFYLGRLPYLVGGKAELEFGIEQVGGSPRILRSFEELNQRTAGRRVFCLSRNREPFVSWMRRRLGAAYPVLRTPGGALVLRLPIAR